MNDQDLILENADLLIEENKISKTGFNLGERADQVLDAAGKIVLPGFINTHHHLFQTLFRCLPAIQNKPLFPWLTHLYHWWRHLTPEAVRVGALVGIGELLLTGCTTTTDHFYVYPKGVRGDLLDETIQAARDLGIRFYPTRGSISLGQSQGGLPPDELTQTEEEILKDSRRIIETYHDPSPFSLCRIGLSPNAPFSATADLMRSTVKLARETKVMCHTHLAETKDEEEYCLLKFNRRPLRYLEDLEWIGEDIWFAHGIHFNDEELEKLARTKTKIAHCPSSNCRLGSGTAPYPKWKEKKVIFGLGVDGSASNDSSNMWGEVRQFLLVHRAAWGSEIITPYEALKCATRNGSELLRWPEIGSLVPGKAADLILIDIRKIAYAGASYDPVAALVLCGDSFIVDTSIVNGEIVVQNGKLTRASESKIMGEASRIVESLQKRVS